MKIEDMLQRVVDEKASDGFISAGAPPSIKVDGTIFPMNETPLTPAEARELVLSTMDEKQKKEFLEHNELNFAIGDRPAQHLFKGLHFDKPLLGDVRFDNVAAAVAVTDLVDVIFDLLDKPFFLQALNNDIPCFKTLKALELAAVFVENTFFIEDGDKF